MQRELERASIDRLTRRFMVDCRQERHGTGYGGWVVNPERINSDSVVYSFGLGGDVSFDLALIEAYDVQVFGFEFDPASLEWLRTQPIPDSFHVLPYGIADYDGTATLYLKRARAPGEGQGGSPTLVAEVYGSSVAPEKVEVCRLQTIMSMLGHSRVDLLKMDIEGAEYKVLDDVIGSRIPIDQLLVEFHHHNLRSIPARRTRRAVRTLAQNGYRPFHVSKRRAEYSFLGPER